ncbi:MAG: class I SAM-dependent methyltransferase [Ignavibacteria bacterium]|jgi:SAM-dependent methyltransferase|nr:class I SAM-dependent methyltransferase [Ignavibacteria bacterium]
MTVFEKLGINSDEYKTVEYTADQSQTQSTFGYQWSRTDTYDSETASNAMKEWLLERYCEGRPEMLKKYLGGGGKIILDAGCGGGYSGSLLFGEELNNNYYLGVDISDAVSNAKRRFQEMNLKGEFLKASILDLPVPDESVDIIFSEGVLHHTDSTEKALKYLAKKIKKGGLFMFYVYAKKAVIREFSDDFIREELKDKTNEEAWEALKPLTKLGIALGELKEEIEVPEEIPYLGIKKGRYNIQRFFYWNIMKAFYRSDFSLEEMNHINFDWYRPLNCFRHTEEEIRKYCLESNLSIEFFNSQEAGFTVIARKT